MLPVSTACPQNDRKGINTSAPPGSQMGPIRLLYIGAKMPDEANVPPSIADAINQIIKAVKDLEALFIQQRKLLKEQGINLPVGTLLGLQQLAISTEALAKASEESQIELQ